MHQQRGADAAITAPQDDAGVAGPEAAVLEPAPVSHRPSSRSDTVQSTGPEAAGRELLGVPQADPGGIAETTVRNRRYAVRRSPRNGTFSLPGARTSGQRGHFRRPRQPENPKQAFAREGLQHQLLPQRPLLKLSALVHPR